MHSKQELYNHLKSLLKLLNEEKEALLHNDGFKVAEIVDKKSELIEKISQFRDNEVCSGGSLHSPDINKIIEEINSIQETNFLLTQQSLSYQNILLESIAKNLQNMSNTYSSKGSYQKTNNIGLIDQEV